MRASWGYAIFLLAILLLAGLGVPANAECIPPMNPC